MGGVCAEVNRRHLARPLTQVWSLQGKWHSFFQEMLLSFSWGWGFGLQGPDISNKCLAWRDLACRCFVASAMYTAYRCHISK